MTRDVALCTTRDVAREYGVDSSTVRRWVAEKKLKPAATTPGGQYRFDPVDVAQLLNPEGHKPGQATS